MSSLKFIQVSRRGFLMFAPLAALVVCGAGDADERPDNKRLPKCDRVEVLRIEGSTLVGADGELLFKREQRPAGQDAYFIEYAGGSWTKVHGTKTLRGDDAERIAALWRELAPKPPPPGVFVGLAKCHVPGFAFRFYSGDKLLAESTVCWTCENFGIRMGEKFAARGFDTKAQAAKDLLAAGLGLFPGVKTGFDK